MTRNASLIDARKWCGFCAAATDHFDAECPHRGTCYFCKKRPATLHFGDSLSFTHGGFENCCALCAAEMQLSHARERAQEIPALEARVSALKAETAE